MLELLLTAVLWLQSASVQPAGFVLIVNDANPVEALPREAVSDIFMRKTQRWEGWEGKPRTDPVDQRLSSSVREAFTRRVHRKRLSRINSYWTRMIFSGRGAPPPEVISDSDVVDFVRENAGAIGYVAPSTELLPGVKLLEMIEDS